MGGCRVFVFDIVSRALEMRWFYDCQCLGFSVLTSLDFLVSSGVMIDDDPAFDCVSFGRDVTYVVSMGYRASNSPIVFVAKTICHIGHFRGGCTGH